MIRRYGPPPDRARRYRVRPGAYAILMGRGARAGQVLLTETDEIQLPGGGIDPGEGPARALVREVREETGHACRLVRRLGAYRRYVWMPEYGMHAEKLCHVYLGHAGPRLGPPSEADHSALWAPARRAAAMLDVEGDRAYAAAVLGGPS